MSKARFRGWVPVALLAAFAAGAAIDGWLRTYGPPKPATRAHSESADAFLAAPPSAPAAKAPAASAPRAANPPAPVATGGDIPHGRLRIPIDGENIETFKNGFTERRGGDRPHEAVDMLAPRNTPVHAVESGSIAKLFTSKAGGLTIYQFDPTGHLCYYYAHLERYADGLAEGQAVKRGDVIGYVGYTGNANPAGPHLHFAIVVLGPEKRWWEGTPINPYPVLIGATQAASSVASD